MICEGLLMKCDNWYSSLIFNIFNNKDMELTKVSIFPISYIRLYMLLGDADEISALFLSNSTINVSFLVDIWMYLTVLTSIYILDSIRCFANLSLFTPVLLITNELLWNNVLLIYSELL